MRTLLKKEIECNRCGNVIKSAMQVGNTIIKRDGKWFCCSCSCVNRNAEGKICLRVLSKHEKCEYCGRLTHGEHCCDPDIIKIKEKCFICNHPMLNTIKRFIVKGNSCDVCIAKVMEALKNKGEIDE